MRWPARLAACGLRGEFVRSLRTTNYRTARWRARVLALRIETTMAHPKRGFVKLEDTVVVTKDGCVGLGDVGRGWNRAGG